MAVSKRSGKKSLAANDHLIPLPPGPPVATDVGTDRPFDNAAALVTFEPSTTNPPTVSYVVSSYSASDPVVKTASGSSSPILVTGLKSNTIYSFTIVGSTIDNIPSPPSDPSNNVLVTSIPQSPTQPTVTTSASSGQNQPEGQSTAIDDVSWSAQANGGKSISIYNWYCSDGKSGSTANTSVSVTQESGTAQTYTVTATNSNGTSSASVASASITSAFSFAPFGAFAFSPFAAFGFSPFAAFSFSPFKAFSFSPFRAFSFAPFRAFSFAPFRAFSFTPKCIASNTKISVVDAEGKLVLVPAKDLKVGDSIISPIWAEYESGELIDHLNEKVDYLSMSDLSAKVVSVKEISSEVVSKTIVFNNDKDLHFSTMQPILAKKQGTETFAWEITRDITINDVLMKYDTDTDEYVEVLVTDIMLISDVEETVYRITPDEYLTFIAGGIVCC